MASVSDQIVREYFERHGFFVRQRRKHVSATSADQEEADFWVWQPSGSLCEDLQGWRWTQQDTPASSVGMVRVVSWHTDTISAGVVENGKPFVQDWEIEGEERQEWGWAAERGRPLRLMVLPRLPKTQGACQECLRMLGDRGVDGVTTFEAMIGDLLQYVEVNRHYARSDLLQMLRLLKNYGWIRSPQMELFERNKPRRPRKGAKPGEDISSK